MTAEFLEVEDVLDIHELQVAEFGGADGLRDRALLESAVAQPRATFDGEPVHSGLAEMAAAYLFHLVRNHPSVDGNKRTALVAALVFLEINGAPIEGHSPRLYDLTMAAAEGRLGKAEVTAQLRAIARDEGHSI